MFSILPVFESSPNKKKAKVIIEHNSKQALIGFSEKKWVDYESIDIVQEEEIPRLKDKKE